MHPDKHIFVPISLAEYLKNAKHDTVWTLKHFTSEPMNVFKVLFICLCVGNIQKHHVSSCSCSPRPPVSLCYLNIMNQEQTRQCIRVFVGYFTSSWQTKSVLLEPASVSASVVPVSLPSVPAYGSPGAKSQEMRYSYHPRGVWKGHLFHRCRWRSSWRSNVGLEWKTAEYQRGKPWAHSCRFWVEAY